LFEWDQINWADVLVNTLISIAVSIIVALILRYFIIENINRIHNKNRDGMIRGLLTDAHRVHNIMKSVFAIIVEQQDFTPNHVCVLLHLTDGEKGRLNYYHNQIHAISERMIAFNDWKLFMDYDENLTIANYVHYSDLFLEPLLREIPQYSTEDLEERKKYALKIIDLFGDLVPEEFRNDWNQTP